MGRQSAYIVNIAGATLAVNTTQYADNDLVGTKITIPVGVKSGLLQYLTLQDLDAQNAALEVYLFRANPANTTFTNNSDLDVADGDLPLCITVFSVAAADYVSLADNSVGTVKDLALPFVADDGLNLYAAFRSASATPTYSANGLSILSRSTRTCALRRTTPSST